MRPIRLTLNAFGPFAGKEVVDFTAALDAGIFGIYGDTGSGKTTIFDGIAFALFGQSSGAERMPDDMLSHYADPKEITFVELAFDLGEKRYVIRRIPRQERAASRGEGMTSQAHEVYLFDATGLVLDQITEQNSGEMLAEKKTSLVDPMVKELLGYDASQFRQIVLLPQGDFRKILTASSDERSPILKRLFDVSLYETFVQKIRTEASALRREIQDERLRMETLLDGNTEDALGEEIAAGQQAVSKLVDRLKLLTTEASSHQLAFTSAEALNEKFTALADAQKDEKDLASQSEAINASVARIAKARAAQSVLPAETLRNRMVKELSDALQQKTDTDGALKGAESAQNLAADECKRIVAEQPARDVATQKVQKLDRWKGILDKSALLQRPLFEANQAAETSLTIETEAKAKVTGADEKLKELRLLQTTLPKHTKAVSQAIAELTKLQQEAELSGRYEAVLLKRDQQSRNIAELNRLHQTALSVVAECSDTFSQAEQELTDIQALHVARKLKDGEPCPACGSFDHPEPATGDPARLGRHETFEAADQALKKAEQDEREAKGRLDSGNIILADRQQELDTLIKPERDSKTLVSLVSSATSTKETLERDTRFNDLEARLASAEEAFKNSEVARSKATEELAGLQKISDNAQTALTTTLSEVPEDWRQEDVLEDALSTAKSEMLRLEQEQSNANDVEKIAALALAASREAQRNAVTNVAKVETASQEAEATFVLSLETTKMSLEGFQSAKSDIDQLGGMEASIQTYRDHVASNADRRRRLVEEIEEQKKPDLDGLKTVAQACTEKLMAGREEQTRLATELERKNTVFVSVTKLSAAIGQLEIKYAPLGEISNLVNGDNELKVRLPDFAIAAMFDEVLAAANLRLAPMTNQRYQLHRPSETTGGRAKRGLEIAVFDANTEKSRSTTSLSGGEGFQASLALALGLSDVVQQNSGGIKLDAIFIDEGFGTLDQETLDTALDTLCSLTGEMRAVGLISHTEQVKTLITAGFDIEVTPSGSHIHARSSVMRPVAP